MTDTEYTNGIPPISAYAHWNEDAERVWYEENKYDMMYPPERDPYDDDYERYYEEPYSYDKCIEIGAHSRDTSGYQILFGPNADLIVYAGVTCDNCEEDLASDWEPKGYRTKTDTMIVYREDFTKAGRKHVWTDEARFAVYERVT